MAANVFATCVVVCVYLCSTIVESANVSCRDTYHVRGTQVATTCAVKTTNISEIIDIHCYLRDGANPVTWTHVAAIQTTGINHTAHAGHLNFTYENKTIRIVRDGSVTATQRFVCTCRGLYGNYSGEWTFVTLLAELTVKPAWSQTILLVGLNAPGGNVTVLANANDTVLNASETILWGNDTTFVFYYSDSSASAFYANISYDGLTFVQFLGIIDPITVVEILRRTFLVAIFVVFLVGSVIYIIRRFRPVNISYIKMRYP